VSLPERLAGWFRRDGTPPVRLRYALGRDQPEPGFQRPNQIQLLQISLKRRMPSPEKWLYRIGLRSSDDLTLPEVLCIGAQKGGTTWLYRNLRQHPGVFLPPDVKEVHYFDLLFQEKLSEYARVFAAGGDRVKCDITPNYGRLRAARIRFIRSVMPDVRLIFLMRDPVERAWSQALMDLVTRTGRSYEQVPAKEFYAHFRSPRIQQNGLYTRLLTRWLSIFPERQLLVGFVEDLHERPRELLGRIFRHIGVSQEVDWSGFPYDRRIHRGPAIPLPDSYRRCLEEIFAEEIERLATRFGGPAQGWRRR
jgi:hypothetical protein